MDALERLSLETDSRVDGVAAEIVSLRALVRRLVDEFIALGHAAAVTDLPAEAENARPDIYLAWSAGPS
jgi:hypothetical protein